MLLFIPRHRHSHIVHVAAPRVPSLSEASFEEGKRRKSYSAREETRPERQAAAGAKQYKFSFVVHSDFPGRFETVEAHLTEVCWVCFDNQRKHRIPWLKSKKCKKEIQLFFFFKENTHSKTKKVMTSCFVKGSKRKKLFIYYLL